MLNANDLDVHGQTMESYIYRCYRIPWSDEDSGSLTPG